MTHILRLTYTDLIMTFLPGQVTLQLDILQNAFPTLIPLQKTNSPTKKKPKKKYLKNIDKKP